MISFRRRASLLLSKPSSLILLVFAAWPFFLASSLICELRVLSSSITCRLNHPDPFLAGSVNVYFLIEDTYLPLESSPGLEAKLLESGYDPYNYLYDLFEDADTRKVLQQDRTLGMTTLCGRQWYASDD